MRDNYDYIIIDCSPSLGLITVNCLTAADSVMIPVQPEFFALEGLGKLLQTIRLVQGGVNPSLTIDMESAERYMPYLCHSTKESDAFNSGKNWWHEVYRKMKQSKTQPDRMVASVFADADFVSKYVNPADFMWGIYWLASDAQKTEGKINFYDLFTDEELFNLWE